MYGLLFTLALAGDPRDHDIVVPRIRDVVHLSDPARITLAGPLASRFALVAKGRLSTIEEDELLAGFEKRPGSQPWIGEHVGKWMHAASLVVAASGDESLAAKIERVKQRLIATQESDGYLGTYLPEKRFGLYEGADWDVWVHKYALLGLLADWRYRDSVDALMAARRSGDVICETFGAGGKDLIAAGTHAGMAATSILEPMVQLYRCTDEARYRDFCLRLIERMGEPGGPNLLNDLLANRPIAEIANGKAYEMLSNLVGFCELYRQLGDPRFKAALENAWNDIVAMQLYPTGTASTGEFWQREAIFACDADAHLGETCVTVTWAQLNLQLYALSGDAKYIEEFERTIYNHLLAAQAGAGSDWCYFTPLAGKKEFRSDINCCHSSGPRALALLPTVAVTRTGESIRVNLYDFARADFEIKGNRVTLERHGDPWSSEGCAIRVTASMPGTLEISLRKPSYAAAFECRVGEQSLTESTPGFVTVRHEFQKDGGPLEITVRGLANLTTNDARRYGRADEVVLSFGPFVLAPDPGFVAPSDLGERTARLETVADPEHGESWRVVIGREGEDAKLVLPTFASRADGEYRVFVPRTK